MLENSQDEFSNLDLFQFCYDLNMDQKYPKAMINVV